MMGRPSRAFVPEMGAARRSRYDIIAKILSVAQDGAGKTSILYHANLNFGMVNRYLDFLIQEGMIATGSTKYKTTERGLEFLKAYKSLRGTTKGGL